MTQAVSGEWVRMYRRVRAMHRLWAASTVDLSVEQVNYRERTGVLPIAFSLVHFVTGEDRASSTYLLEEPSLWDSDDWAERIGGAMPPVRRGTAVDVAETVRIGNYDAWLDYQRTVFGRTEDSLQQQPAKRFHVEIYPALTDQLRGSFLGLVIEEGEPVRLSEILHGFIFQHGIRHLGEIDHARSLLGLQGVS